MPTPPLSVVVLTRDEELNLPRCLASVAWCSDLHVVDSGSTDGTIEIAKSFGANVLHHAFVDHPSQWAWALAHLPLEGDWLLALDADHRVTDALAHELRHALPRVAEQVAGLYIPHRYIFRGHTVRGLKTEWLQLVRHTRARVDSSELVDSRFQVDGLTRRLHGYLVEENLREQSIEFWTVKHLRYARRTAAEEILRKRSLLAWDIQPRLSGTTDERTLWLKKQWYRLPLGLRPLVNFAYRYVWRGGFLDGRSGLVFHLLHSLWFRLLVDLSLEELDSSLKTGSLNEDALYTAARTGSMP